MNKFILFLVVGFTLLPLFKPGLFDVHDPTSIIRFFTIKQTLLSGQFPAAWTNLLNHGYGYPLFLYYAPVFSYLGFVATLFVPSYLLALKISLTVLVVVAALGMYKLMRQFVESAGTTIAAVSYTLLPYHASTLYVRGSYAEGVTWALLPWLLYLWSKPIRGTRWALTAGVITSLFFLSHNSLPFAFIPLLLIWIYLFRPKQWGSTILAAMLFAGLSCWFLIPVLFERNLVQIEQIATLTNYRDHFLSLSQLWHSPWGYGGSAKTGEVDGMSFMLGKSQLVISLIVLLGISWRKNWSRPFIFFALTLIFYAWMTTVLAGPIWQLIPALGILQFPWRLLAFAGFGLSGMLGYSTKLIPQQIHWALTIFITIFLLFFNLKFFKPERSLILRDSDFLSQEKLDTLAEHKIPEYLPAAMSEFPSQAANDGLTRTPISVSGSLVLDSPGPITIATAYMPQWVLQVDGKKVDITPTNTGAIISSPVSAGKHELVLAWKRTWTENLGLGISALALLIVIGLLFI